MVYSTALITVTQETSTHTGRLVRNASSQGERDQKRTVAAHAPYEMAQNKRKMDQNKLSEATRTRLIFILGCYV